MFYVPEISCMNLALLVSSAISVKLDRLISKSFQSMRHIIKVYNNSALGFTPLLLMDDSLNTSAWAPFFSAFIIWKVVCLPANLLTDDPKSISSSPVSQKPFWVETGK